MQMLGLSYKKNNDNNTYRKVNIEYLNLFLPHLKKYNPVCALCVQYRYFGKNISKSTSLHLKYTLKCNGSDCKFNSTVHILNNGLDFITSPNRHIFHHAEATFESLLSPNITHGILRLHNQLADEINLKEIIKGALQLVQLRPFCVVRVTEAATRLYDTLIIHPELALPWDATGGIMKNTESSSKQCLYYEFTISHPNIVNEDSLIPLTFILSESQSLLTIT